MTSIYLFAQARDMALLIEESAEGIFLYTVKPNAVIGDTWHPNVEEAKAQAAYNANGIVGPWRTVTREFGNKVKTGKSE
ncbi:MAG TPA: hypothetical protein VID67_07955 [Rhizomicrobium sp.]|jgi:hypothetical protein